MLLPWSKSDVLTIAQDGIALQLPNQPLQMLSTQAIGRDYSGIFEVLQQHQDLLAQQKLRLVLSNAFVRFAILNWQNEVFNRQDWLGLAQHTFRQEYGNSADNWVVRVSLGAYGESVIASAIDQALYDTLMESAKQIGFKWQAIEPLAMRLLGHAQAGWLVIAEPEHLLLCQKTQGQFTQFSVASPPGGQEAVVSQQMLARALLQLGATEAPIATQVIVSSQLSEQWRQAKTAPAHVKTVLGKQRQQHHAAWLATV